MHRAYKAYLVRRTFAPALVLAYAAVAITATSVRHNELFPFFNWSLFSTSSNPKFDTVLIVRSIDGKPLQRPQLFYSLTDHFGAARTRDSRLAKALDRWANAILTGDDTTSISLKRVTEQTFMREAKSVDYDVAVIRFDPIERLNNGIIRETKILASFKK